MKWPKNRPLGSTIFAYKDNMTLVSYKTKNKKLVLALSTLYPEDDTSSCWKQRNGQTWDHLGLQQYEVRSRPSGRNEVCI